jgi:CheY-like chemotaxis protein
MTAQNLIGKNILLVEDNTINQMLVKYTLSPSGVFIDVCDTGTQALLKLQEKKYDLILMDIHMPELDGYQTTQIIRSELRLQTPIVALTALSISGEEEKCIGLGMNGYLSKPFSVEGLNSAISKLLPTQMLRQSFNIAS